MVQQLSGSGTVSSKHKTLLQINKIKACSPMFCSSSQENQSSRQEVLELVWFQVANIPL